MDVKELIEKYETVIRINTGFGESSLKCDSKRLEKFELENELVRDFIKELKQLSNVKYNRKVKVKQFVADWFKHCENRGYSLCGAMTTGNEMSDEMKLWLVESSNQLMFARAYEYGYKVEEEPKYRVVLPNPNSTARHMCSCLKRVDGMVK